MQEAEYDDDVFKGLSWELIEFMIMIMLMDWAGSV